MTAAAEPLPGRLLVAAPALADENFAHTVVLLLEHSDDGTVGVVLNRPSETAVAEVLPGWESLAAEPAVVFVGGPVQQDGVLGLEPIDGAVGVGMVDLEADPTSVAREPMRLFAGYAGWDDGQLAAEIEAGGWFVVAGSPGDVFTADPADLWRTVLQRQGGIFRTVPENPAMN